MKIICIDGNYCNNGDADKSPAELSFFMKPESAILRNRHPFFIPGHTRQVIPRINLALKICRLGRNIHERFAHLYYDEIGMGVDMEAADVLLHCRENGMPWEIAKAFDFSCPLGNFIPKSGLDDLCSIPFSLHKNGLAILQCNSSSMRFSFDKIIAHVSSFITLKMGDYIFTGSPETNKTVAINDKIDCYLGERKMLAFVVK